MRDTFQTILYKLKFIQTCYDRELKREIITVDGREFTSLHAAKCWITRSKREVNPCE